MPVISNATNVTVGVYAGDLKTTTPAEIPCLISILCADAEATDGRIKEYRDQAQKAAEEAKRAAEVLVSPTISVTEIDGGHRITISDMDGDESFDVMDGEGSSSGGGSLSPELVEFINTLKAEHDKDNYTGQMTGTFTPTGIGGTYEIGTTIEATYTWSFTKKIHTLKIDGKTQKDLTQTSATRKFVSADLGKADDTTDDTILLESASFSVLGVCTGPYGDEPASKTWTYKFQNKRYWGMAEAPTDENGELVTPDGDFIKKLKVGNTNGEFATDYKKSFNLKDSSSDKYIWYAYPSRLGAATFKMGGFRGGFTAPYTVLVTNSKGFTENYYLYRSAEKGVGTLDILVE